MRLTVWSAVALVTSALALFAGLLGVAVLHATAPRSCDDADASRHAHLLVQAEKQYAAVLSDEPSSTCARKGMGVVVAVLCTRARRLESYKRTAEAAKAYASLLAKEPPSRGRRTCAANGLSRIGEPPTPPGPVVVAGPAGKDGRNGTDGKDGKDGTDGKDGEDGTDGEDGIDGTDGEDGTNGRAGATGKDGRNGKDGTNGRAGAPGKDSRNDKDGTNGRAGAPGKDGRNGRNGKDGKSTTTIVFCRTKERCGWTG